MSHHFCWLFPLCWLDHVLSSGFPFLARCLAHENSGPREIHLEFNFEAKSEIWKTKLLLVVTLAGFNLVFLVSPHPDISRKYDVSPYFPCLMFEQSNTFPYLPFSCCSYLTPHDSWLNPHVWCLNMPRSAHFPWWNFPPQQFLVARCSSCGTVAERSGGVGDAKRKWCYPLDYTSLHEFNGIQWWFFAFFKKCDLMYPLVKWGFNHQINENMMIDKWICRYALVI